MLFCVNKCDLLLLWPLRYLYDSIAFILALTLAQCRWDRKSEVIFDRANIRLQEKEL
jgi:hypothetical protein